MSFGFLKSGKFLLTAGLLLVLAQGLLELPELQDYFFPKKYLEFNLDLAKLEFWKIEKNLESLKARVSYLQWFLAHRSPEDNISKDWLLRFPFSESLRWLSPKIFWHLNIYALKRTRIGLERKLKYLNALINDIKINTKSKLSHNNADYLTDSSGVNISQIIQNFDQLWASYNQELKTLTPKSILLENLD